ncbi:hypothetical protein M9458_041224, partial [Cirrhinus mrigala]
DLSRCRSHWRWLCRSWLWLSVRGGLGLWLRELGSWCRPPWSAKICWTPAPTQYRRQGSLEDHPWTAALVWWGLV